MDVIRIQARINRQTQHTIIPTYKLYCTCRGHSSINCGGKLASTRLYSDSTRAHSSHVKIYQLTITKSQVQYVQSLLSLKIPKMLQPFNTSSSTVSGICILYAYSCLFYILHQCCRPPFFILHSSFTAHAILQRHRLLTASQPTQGKSGTKWLHHLSHSL